MFLGWAGVDAARMLAAVPVLKIDEPMAKEAIRLGSRIGVIATVPTALYPTADLLQQEAQAQQRMISVDPVLCEGAFELLTAGNIRGHDEAILSYLRPLMERVDVVWLAQASMARAVEQLTAAERTIPLLSSPRLGMQRALQILHEQI